MTPEKATYILSILTVFSQIILLFFIAIILFPKLRRHFSKYITHQNQLMFSYIIAFVATMGSLYYSEIAGYTPCKMCWFQRIFMYPQVILYFVSILIKDKLIKWYGISLSIIGTFLAAYHYLLQIGVIQTTSCSTVGFSISCSDRFTTTFGYITIPMMALSAFLLIIATWLLSFNKDENDR